MTFENQFRNFVGRCKQREFSKVELMVITNELLNLFNEEQRIDIKGWKGKSSFEIKDLGDTIYVTKYQKKERGSEPIEINFKIKTKELGFLKNMIVNWFRFKRNLIEDDRGECIRSREVAECFYGEGWDKIFNNRKRHNHFTIMLNVLDKKGLIDYRGGKVRLKQLNF